MNVPSPIAVISSGILVVAVSLAIYYRPEPSPYVTGEVVSKVHVHRHGRPGHQIPECYRLDLQLDVTGEKPLRGLCVSPATFDRVQIGDTYTEQEEDRDQ